MNSLVYIVTPFTLEKLAENLKKDCLNINPERQDPSLQLMNM